MLKGHSPLPGSSKSGKRRLAASARFAKFRQSLAGITELDFQLFQIADLNQERANGIRNILGFSNGGVAVVGVGGHVDTDSSGEDGRTTAHSAKIDPGVNVLDELSRLLEQRRIIAVT